MALPCTTSKVEECFEDPFGLRLIPDSPRFAEHARFICLGKDLEGLPWFIVYTMNRKQIRVVALRRMAPGELNFYEGKLREVV